MRATTVVTDEHRSTYPFIQATPSPKKFQALANSLVLQEGAA